MRRVDRVLPVFECFVFTKSTKDTKISRQVKTVLTAETQRTQSFAEKRFCLIINTTPKP